MNKSFLKNLSWHVFCWSPVVYFVHNNCFTFIRVPDNTLEPEISQNDLALLTRIKSQELCKGDLVLCNYPGKNDIFVAKVRETEGHLITSLSEKKHTKIDQVRLGHVAIENVSWMQKGKFGFQSKSQRPETAFEVKQIPVSCCKGKFLFKLYPDFKRIQSA